MTYYVAFYNKEKTIYHRISRMDDNDVRFFKEFVGEDWGSKQIFTDEEIAILSLRFNIETKEYYDF